MPADNRRKSWRPGRIVGTGLLVLFLLSVAEVMLFGVIRPPFTPLMVIRVLEKPGIRHRLRWEWRPLDRISPEMPRAVVASEDATFCSHFGFDWDALAAAWQRYVHGAEGARLRGGSTITMQTAKNIFLWPDKSLVRKALEAYFTVLLELFWTKERILEVYLNVIEWGDGIYGVEAAAETYFHKPARDLTAGEAARLAAVLPNPHVFNPARPSSYVLRRAHIIARRMGAYPAATDFCDAVARTAAQ